MAREATTHGTRVSDARTSERQWLPAGSDPGRDREVPSLALTSSSRRARVYAFALPVCVASTFHLAARLAQSYRCPVGALAIMLAEGWAISWVIRELFFYAIRSPGEGGGADPGAPTAERPLVDILIPTYNEATDLLRTTVLCALRQDSANVRVWIADDGHREAVRLLAEELGARYVARDSRAGNKAGNLNHALSRLPADGRFVAVLDADFAPTRDFARRALARFEDSRVGLVQTSQLYYNADLLQRALHATRWLPNWNRLAFDTILPCQDARDEAFCTGSSFVMRRSAIQELGGFPTDSLSENRLLAARLKQHGLHTRFLSAPLSYGLAAESIAQFWTQRFRWTLGSMQNLRRLLRAAPDVRSLRLLRRVELGLHVQMFQLLRIGAAVLVTVVGVCGWDPASVLGNVDRWALGVACVWGLRTLAFAVLSRGVELPLISDARSWLAAPPALVATAFDLLGRGERARFVVTDKVETRTRTHVFWPAAAPLAVLAGGVAAGCVRMALPRPNAHPAPFGIAAYLLAGILLALWACVERRERRRAPRFEIRWPCSLLSALGTRSGVVRNISIGGGRLMCVDERYRAGDEIAIGIAGDSLRGVVVTQRGDDIHFRFEDEASRDVARRLLFSDGHAPVVVRLGTTWPARTDAP